MRTLTVTDLAERGQKLARLLAEADQEEKDFNDRKAAHKARIELLNARASRIRFELATGCAEDEQLELPTKPEPVPADDEQGETTPTARTVEEEDAFTAGKQAREADEPEDSCPYLMTDLAKRPLRLAWVGGWNTADAEITDAADLEPDGDEDGNTTEAEDAEP